MLNGFDCSIFKYIEQLHMACLISEETTYGSHLYACLSLSKVNACRMTTDILQTCHLNFGEHILDMMVVHTCLPEAIVVFFYFCLVSRRTVSFFVFRSLDLSFNLIKTIQNLNSLSKLKKLFLVQNKISKIVGLQNLQQLEMLELGANKIRVRVQLANACLHQ